MHHTSNPRLWLPPFCLWDFMMAHFSTSMPINGFGMGLVAPVDTGMEPDSGTTVMNSLLKLRSRAPPLFLVVVVICFTSPSPPPVPSLTIFPLWWIGFQLLSVNTISHRSCPILPQQHMCGDTDQRGNRHFRAMGLGCMQHKTSNGGLLQTAIDVPWDCMSQNKQRHTNMLMRGAWHVKNNGTSSQNWTHTVVF